VTLGNFVYLSIHIIALRSCPEFRAVKGEGVWPDCSLSKALLPQGWVRNVRMVLDQGRLGSVETEASAQSSDERHRIGLPGLPNLHSHAFQRGMAGLTEIRGTTVDSFWTWRDLMYRFVGRMTADDIEAVAAQAYVEMLEAGFTRVGEFSLHPS